MPVPSRGFNTIEMSSLPKCAACGAWGKGVVKADGVCDHCRANGHGGGGAGGGKRPRPADEAEGDAKRPRPSPPSSDLSAEEIQQLLAEADAHDVPELDTTGVKKMLLQLERRITGNLHARSKHAGEAAAYLDSEVELHGAIKGLQALAAAPEQYTTLAHSDSLASLLGLLTHENSDIATCVLALFNELLRDESVGEAGEAGEELGRAVLSGGGAELLLAGLTRLNDATDANDSTGMLASLELFLSLLDLLGAEGAEALGGVTASAAGTTVCGTHVHPCSPLLLAFLLDRTSRKEMDDVKGLSAELLAVLLSSSPSSSAALGVSSFTFMTPKGKPLVLDGVEYLLQLVNAYKKKAPETLSSSEKEVVENVLDALSTALLVPANQARFQAAEGFELLLRTVHENGFARACALRVLDFAVADNAHGALSLVVAGGLKAVFPAFMGKGLVQTRRWQGSEAAEGEEERCVSTVGSLFYSLLPGAPAQGGAGVTESAEARTALMRLLAKFGEGGGEKLDRLLELRAKYSSKVEAGGQEGEEGDGLGSDEEDDDETRGDKAYVRRMRAGLFTLQRLDCTLARLLTLPERLGGAGPPAPAPTPGQGQGGTAVASGAVQGHDAHLAFAQELACATRAKLYEQGASIVALLDTLQEYGGRLEGEGQEKADIAWMTGCLQALGGLTVS